MAASVKGVGTASAGFTAATAVALPTGAGAPAAGDIILIVEESANATLPAAPTGYTTLFQQSSTSFGSGSTTQTVLSVFGKIAGASESNPTVNPGNNHSSAQTIVIQGHGCAAITDVVVGTDNGATTGTSLSLNGLTGLAANSLVLMAVATSNDVISTAQFTGWANANLSGITEWMDNAVNTGNGGGFGLAVGTCAGTSTGTSTVTQAASIDWIGVQLAIRPAGGSSGITGSGSAGVPARSAQGSGSLGPVPIQGSGAAGVPARHAHGVGSAPVATGSGPRTPTSVIDANERNTASWQTPLNARVDDNSYATYILGSTATPSDHLKATSYGFTIPTTATITGILVEINRRETGVGSAADDDIRLLKAGTAVGTNKADTATNWPGTAAYASYGGTYDLWGTTWTPADINASNFGVQLAVGLSGGTSAQPEVDVIRVTVYYTTPPNPSGSGSANLMPLLAAGSGAVKVAGSGSAGATGSGSAFARAAVGSGAVKVSGSGAAGIPPRLAQGSGKVTTHGTGSAGIPARLAQGSGKVTTHGTGSAGVPARLAQGAGTLGAVPRTGSGAAGIPARLAQGSGAVKVQGTGAAGVPARLAQGAGRAVVRGAGAAGVPARFAAGSAKARVSGQGAAQNGPASLSGAAKAIVRGVGSAQLAPQSATGAAKAKVTGSGSAGVPARSASGSGAVFAAGSGHGAAGLAPMQAQGSGRVQTHGAGAAQLAPLDLTGSGDVVVGGSGAAGLGVLDLTGSGSVQVSGGGTVQLGPDSAAGSGSVLVAGVGTAQLAALAAAGIGRATAYRLLAFPPTTHTEIETDEGWGIGPPDTRWEVST